MARVTSVRLSDELATQLDKLAAAVDRPKAWLIEQAISRYVEDEAWQVQAIAEALSEYRSGTATLRSHEDVMRRLETKIRERRSDADNLA